MGRKFPRMIWKGSPFSGVPNAEGYSMQLTKHFTLEELIRSDLATRQGIDNTPNEEQIENLHLLCKCVLQPLRNLVGEPVHILSGFRCEELNLLCNGASNSQHKEGKAADLIIGSFEPIVVCQMIADHFPYDQLIEEFEQWTHVSYNPSGNRSEKLLAVKDGRWTEYKKVQRFV